MHQPWEQEPRCHWTQLWVHPQVREDLGRGCCRTAGGGAARDREGTKTRGRGDRLWGLKDLALLLGSQQGPRADMHEDWLDQHWGLAELEEVPCAWSQNQNSGGWVERTEETEKLEDGTSATGDRGDVAAGAEPKMPVEADTGDGERVCVGPQGGVGPSHPLNTSRAVSGWSAGTHWSCVCLTWAECAEGKLEGRGWG